MAKKNMIKSKHIEKEKKKKLKGRILSNNQKYQFNFLNCIYLLYYKFFFFI